MKFKVDEISSVIKQEIEHYRSEMDVSEVGTVLEVGDGIARVLGAMRAHCRAQEALFPLRGALPPVNAYFVEEPWRTDPDTLAATPAEGVSVGLHRGKPQADGRGGFSLFVPETYDGSRDWPLVVALHGGSGDGRDFLWSWLREARGRRFLLLAPTSRYVQARQRY